MYFYNNFRCLRNNSLLSLRSLAKQCYIGSSNLSRINKGIYKEENLPLLTVSKIANYFKISLNDLVNKDLEKCNFDICYKSEMNLEEIYVRENMIYFLKINQISLYRLSKEIDISRITLVRIRDKMSNEKNITIRTVMKLSEYFNIPLDDFVFKDFSNENEIKLTR